MHSTGLYDETPPWRSHAFEVPHGHVLHVAQSGNPDGVCALVLHGGPGSGGSPLLRRFFDPARFRIVAPDQRGAGRSRPRGETAHNRTGDLLDDLRRLRAQLGIARWLVVGGSWGATLALAHALDEPQAVSGLLLRAVFLPRAADIAEFFQDTAGRMPGEWARFAAVAPAQRRDDMLGFLAEGLAPGAADADAARRLALAWWRWERTRAGSPPPPGEPVPDPAALDALVDRYRVQSHYLRHRCWLDGDPPLLERLQALPRVPTLLLHARDDRVCPPQGAEAVQARIAGSRLQWVDGAGHDPAHPAMARAMVAALDRFARHGDFAPGAAP